jgi:tetratricopeptide (TPR) repeat protein
MTGRQDIFQQAMNQGHSAAWDQMWDRAAGYYRKALSEMPENPQALTSLGLALIELQEFDEALYCYQRAAKALPEDPLPVEKIAQLGERMGNLDLAAQASLRAADLYLKNKDVNKALENWERVTRLNPDIQQAHSRMALVYERMGEKSKAVSEYLALASLQQAEGDLEKAHISVNKAVQILPGSEEAQRAQTLLRDFKPLPRPERPRGGTAPLRMSQVRQLQSPQAAVSPELDPVSQARQKALTILAGMLFEGSDDEESSGRRDLQSIVTGTSSSQNKLTDRGRMMLHLSQVVDLQARGENNQAAEELQRAIDLGLEHPAAAFDLGYLYAQTGRLETAVRQLQRVIKYPDYALGVHLLLGELLQKKGQIKDASIEYLEALKLADAQMVPPEQSNDLLQLYDPIIEAHRQNDSLQIHTRIYDNLHDLLMRPDWRLQLTRAREQLPGKGTLGPAMPLADLLIEARSSQVIDSLSAIYDLLNAGHLRSAMEEAYYSLQYAPTYLPIHSLMGEMLVRQDEFPAAIAKFQVISRTYAARADANQAVYYARKVVSLMPTDLNARGRLIDLLISFGQVEKAIEEYVQLAETYYTLADLAMARKTYMEALRTAQSANVDRALRVRVMHRIADIDMQSLDWRQALRILEQIRTLQPSDEEARLYLIQLNVRLGQEQQALSELDNFIAYMNGVNQLPRLIAFMENLTKEYESHIPMRRRLADLYRQAGRIPDAIHELDAIGDMLLAVGDRAGAIQTVELIISLNPPTKADYQMALEQLRRG